MLNKIQTMMQMASIGGAVGTAISILAGTAIIILLANFLFTGITTVTTAVSSQGKIVSSPELSVEPSTLDWGEVAPGETSQQSVTVTNKGYNPVTLTLSSGNYAPANASEFLTLSWNYSGETLHPGISLPLMMELNVSPIIEGVYNFTFIIVITATTT